MIKAAVFDMDGLLVDSEPIWQEVAIAVFEKVNVFITPEICMESTGLGTTDFVKKMYERFPWEGKSQPQICDEIIEMAHHEIGTRALPMPGALETLRFFKEKSMPIAIASASPMVIIEIVLQRLGIVNYFTLWHSAELEERSKPYPDVYLGAAKKLGIAPEHCIAFEDSGNGLRSASSAGMVTVSVPAEFEYGDPKFDIADIKISSLLHFGENIFNILNQKKQFI
jgi:HAD superfamily hydrolase (TIGR01509 family)